MSDDGTTPRRHVSWTAAGVWWRRGVVASCLSGLGCGTGGARVPDSFKGYDIIISRRDTLSQALVGALRESGFRVRRDVRGGGSPAAGLLHFTFREPEPAPTTWLHARLFDTRSGVILAAVGIRLDAIGLGAGPRARAVVDSLIARSSP